MNEIHWIQGKTRNLSRIFGVIRYNPFHGGGQVCKFRHKHAHDMKWNDKHIFCIYEKILTRG